MSAHGIPDEAFRYFRELHRHEDRDWWHEHRELWDDGVHAPLQALADALAPEFGELTVTRPNRDIRFSSDKRPYQEFAAISRVNSTQAALYLQIDRHGMLVATGLWSPRPEQLRRFRDAVGDDDTAAGLERVLAGLRRHRLPLGDGEPLATAPRGWPRDHPRIELLRRTRLTVERHWEPAAWMRTAECERRIREAWRAGGAWNDWLDEHVGGGSVEKRAGDDL